MFPFWLQTPAQYSSPAITGFLAGTPDFGSTAGQTPVVAPVISGSNFTGASSVLLSGVEHISHCTVTSTTITVNTIVAGAAVAFGTVTVVTPGGMATYGNGTSTGWTYLPAGYHFYSADFIAVSGSEITSFNDVGDQSVDNLLGTMCNIVAIGINSRPTAITNTTAGGYVGTAIISGWTAADSFLAGSGNGVLNGSNSNGVYAMGSSTVGSFYLAFGTNENTDFGSSGNVAALPPVAPITLATLNAGYIIEESLDSSGNYAMINTGVAQVTATSVPVSFNTHTNLFNSVLSSLVGVEFAAWVLYPNTVVSSGSRTIVTNFLSGRYAIALL